MAELYPQPKQQYFDLNGNPLVGGFVYTYAAGSVGTGTPKATYTTAAASVANANPVVLDSRGEATIYWDGLYKVILKDSTNALIWTQDYVPTTAGAAAQPALYLPAGTSVTATKPVFYSYYNVQWAGAVCDGVTDDAAAVNLAANNARAGKFTTLYFPPTTTLVSSAHINITGLGYYIEAGGRVRGGPGLDVFYWKDPSEGGYIAPYMNRFYGFVEVNDTIDVRAASFRVGPCGERVGNAGLAFENYSNTLHLPSDGASYLQFDNVTFYYTTGAYNGQCGLYTGNQPVMYGAVITNFRSQSQSFAWIDGVPGARHVTFDNVTNTVTQTSTGDVPTNNTIVAILSDDGVFCTTPAGLGSRFPYYVINRNNTAKTYQLSLTSGGAAVDFTTNGDNCSIAPYGVSQVGGGSADEISVLRFSASATGEVGVSLWGHNLCQWGDFTVHPGRVWGRFVLYASANGSSSSVHNFNVSYSEGPTGNFASDTFMSGKEYFRNEWPNAKFYGLQLTPIYATNPFMSFIGDDCEYNFQSVTTSANTVLVIADRNKVYVGNTPTYTPVTSYGNSNTITYGSISTGAELSLSPPVIEADTTIIGNAGGVNGDWLETNPTSRYRNKRTLLVPGVSTNPDGVATTAYSNDFTDTTLSIPGALVLPYALGIVPIVSWNGTNITTGLFRIGEFLPAASGTLYCYAKASTGCNVALSLNGTGSTSATTTMALTTSYQLFSVRYDSSGASANATVAVVLGTPSVSAIRYVNFFQFVPDADLTSTNRVALADNGSGTTAQNNLWGGTGAPNNALGSNGDFYFRNDGGASTHLYVKAAGSWSGLV
jgi:hypothetical protein